ncbi:hypothetical protein ASE08_26865 [Rhizobacter sp. Root16D2]|nr:hypothetical protein ASC88_17640 [Rhizobacter sp. Root29]KQW13940.1 hypothetical protein ASC98_17775 [Rhizobacter sp. Root1238]KRB15760.1 hypothetical protein ASE08_26865 [Rhizobacter sp. Root16D2]
MPYHLANRIDLIDPRPHVWVDQSDTTSTHIIVCDRYITLGILDYNDIPEGIREITDLITLRIGDPKHLVVFVTFLD